MSTIPITTEGRVFTAQLMRDIRKREKQGAGVFHPGASTWHEALLGFHNSFLNCGGTVKAGKIFARARANLAIAHSRYGACYLNCSSCRSRSGMFEILTWKVAQHPVSPGRYEGVLVSGNLCSLQRTGVLRMWGRTSAFVSWHALGRMYERWDNSDIERGAVLIGLLGVAGTLMSYGERHRNNAMNIAFEGIHCTGIMRYAPEKYHFFDCLTVLPPEPKYAKQLAQGATVGNLVVDYISADDPDPRGYAERVPVLPYTRSDYVSRELTSVAS